MKTKALIFLLLTVAGFSLAVCTRSVNVKTSDRIDLYSQFKNPENSSRVFVRWWWNGNKLSEKEILRELDVMKEAGIGGVEINPIKFQPAPDPTGYEQIEWLSEDWLSMVKVAVEGAKERGIICDMIIGSGWPFGGEFLSRDEQSQIAVVDRIIISGPAKLSLSKKEIMDRVNPELHSNYHDPVKNMILMRLAPRQMDEFSPGTPIILNEKEDMITIDVPPGEHVLHSVVKITGFMAVINGAKGAGGPVLNHYNKAAVEKYIDRMFDALIKKLGSLSEWFRAFFVDSLELEGANWCDDLFKEFKTRRGYDLEPYYPFMLNKIGRMGNAVEDENATQLSSQVQELVNRVRYDYEITRTELFKERFLDVLIERTKKNNVKLRSQAYGRGYHPIESAFDIDIPENETWFNHQVGLNMPEFISRRPYSMSNKFISSSAHLTGKRLISCEEITNVGSVFNATLEQVKLIGDLSNLSGVSHSVLHGYNYSPPEVPFPGWIQYGTYFSDRNTWWKFFRNWSDYKARLSQVFLNSDMQADIAILQPITDLWTIFGSQRDPYPTLVYPEYAHNLWEAIHQNGGGCDYVSEKVIQSAGFKNGSLIYGNRSYKTLFLMEVESLYPETAMAIKKFVEKGGKLVFIEKEPYKAPGVQNFEKNSQLVADIISEIKSNYPENVRKVNAPVKPIMEWYSEILKNLAITPYISIDKPDKFLSQVYYKTNNLDIFFISNSHKLNTYSINAQFNIDINNKNAWKWDPETGERFLMPLEGNSMALTLNPSESLLLVFDEHGEGAILEEDMPRLSDSTKLDAGWNVTLKHVNGTVSNEKFSHLMDLSQTSKHSDFAGEIVYETSFSSEKYNHSFIDLGEINGVSELWLNDKKLGVVWFGKHRYKIADYLTQGDNNIKIVVTTTLGNYCKSLKDNAVCQRWTGPQSVYPCGMTGPVVFHD